MNSEAFNNLTKAQKLYVESIREIGGIQLGFDITKTDWTRKELVAVSTIRQSNDDVPNWIVKDHSRRVTRGVYSIPEVALEADTSMVDIACLDESDINDNITEAYADAADEATVDENLPATVEEDSIATL